ncbi:hypothetical protein O7C57_15955 [Providencia sp. 21OH12SH02B-Prov]|uniref:hypothetical protein n=1 Tax=Providencia sp. 21OH12SH02B-Prov TaxID=3015951 RepID=UPI0022B74BAA|nr:hypothetical protein [Providencia sp. 21OH12SH02B-Prov]WBA56299.1 hypothetical protein O7C57_15955 [Providencia sp. 21OH12SH02B-Prov]
MELLKSTLGLGVTAILLSHIAQADNGVYVTGKLANSSSSCLSKNGYQKVH